MRLSNKQPISKSANNNRTQERPQSGTHIERSHDQDPR